MSDCEERVLAWGGGEAEEPSLPEFTKEKFTTLFTV